MIGIECQIPQTCSTRDRYEKGYLWKGSMLESTKEGNVIQMKTSDTLNIILNMLYYWKMNDMLYFMCCDSATFATYNFYFYSKEFF